MSLVRFASGDHSDKAPAFLVHGINGSVLPLMTLGQAVGTHRACYGIEARGIDGKREPLDCIEAMAATHIEAIRAVGAPQRWLLAGWSFGGLIAFEMGIQLQSAGLSACVAVLDSRGLVERATKALGPAEMEESYRRHLETFKPTEGHSGPLRDLRACYLAHLCALGSYHPSSFRGPLLVVRAADGNECSDPMLGFGDYAFGAVETSRVAGSHETLLLPSHVIPVAELVSSFFDRFALL